MRRTVQSALLVLIGAGLLHAALLTHLYLRYVKQSLGAPLVASGLLLILLGAANLAMDARRGGKGGHGYGAARREGEGPGGGGEEQACAGHGGAHAGHEDGYAHAGHGSAHAGRGDGQVRAGHGVVHAGREEGQTHAGHGDAHPGHADAHPGRADAHPHGGHGHDHSRAPAVAWLLAFPALSLLLWAPPALGAYTAAHAGAKAPPPARQARFAPLPASAAPLPMTLTGFTERVQQDPARAIRGHAVQLTGFASPAGAGGGWYLTRIIFTCCAADAQTVRVRMYGTAAPPANTWLAVTGTWHPAGVLGTRSAEAALDVRAGHPVAQPVNAFTDDLPLTPS